MTVKRRLERMEETFRPPPEVLPVPGKWVQLFAAIPEFIDPEKTARNYLRWCVYSGQEPSETFIRQLATANDCAAPTSVMERVALVASGLCPFGDQESRVGETASRPAVCGECGRQPPQQAPAPAGRKGAA